MKTSLAHPLHATVLALLALTPGLRADVKLPALISDHMVLQQEAKANVWGRAEPGEKVTVKLGDKSAEATADKDGKWKASHADKIMGRLIKHVFPEIGSVPVSELPAWAWARP